MTLIITFLTGYFIGIITIAVMAMGKDG